RAGLAVLAAGALLTGFLSCCGAVAIPAPFAPRGFLPAEVGVVLGLAAVLVGSLLFLIAQAVCCAVPPPSGLRPLIAGSLVGFAGLLLLVIGGIVLFAKLVVLVGEAGRTIALALPRAGENLSAGGTRG